MKLMLERTYIAHLSAGRSSKGDDYKQVARLRETDPETLVGRCPGP